MIMKRDTCLKALARHLTDEIVVAVYQAAQEWVVIRPSDLNYTFTGAMGQASSHALGLALGRPDKRVIVLDGDGSLLMNLGALVTIAATAPKNLVHFVCENGTYEANGGHPIPGSGVLNFAGMAKAAGYPTTYEFSDLSPFEEQVGQILREDGPVFVDLKVEQGDEYPMDYENLYKAERRSAFKATLLDR
jgi:sulfopyruvate decarboxylase subunit beta